MRLVYMGTPEFAVPSLQALVSTGLSPQVIITQPDRPSGRGQKVQLSPVKRAALELGLPVWQPRRLEDELDRLRQLQPDVIVVVAFGQLLPPEVLAVPVAGSINLHASLLPRYRGAAPINRVVLNGETITGVTTMYMDSGLDTGDILLQLAQPIGPTETFGHLYHQLANAGAKLLVQSLRLLAEGKAPRQAQDASQATYAPSLTREEEQLDWSWDLVKLCNRVRGLNPWPGAYTTVEQRRVKVWEVVPLERVSGVSGSVVELDQRGPVVVTGDGYGLILTRVQPEGKTVMTGGDFLRGYRLRPGVIFGGRGEANT